MQRKELDFSGQSIYMGIDVHLKSWSVTILTESLHHKTFTQPSSVLSLMHYLPRNFPGGVYQFAYGSGFSGLWAHYELIKMGVNNIVVNPADVPSTQKEQMQKTDSMDSRKIVRSLRSCELTGIHIPAISTLEARSLLRCRGAIKRPVPNETTYKVFIDVLWDSLSTDL